MVYASCKDIRLATTFIQDGMALSMRLDVPSNLTISSRDLLLNSQCAIWNLVNFTAAWVKPLMGNCFTKFCGEMQTIRRRCKRRVLRRCTCALNHGAPQAWGNSLHKQRQPLRFQKVTSGRAAAAARGYISQPTRVTWKAHAGALELN